MILFCNRHCNHIVRSIRATQYSYGYEVKLHLKETRYDNYTLKINDISWTVFVMHSPFVSNCKYKSTRTSSIAFGSKLNFRLLYCIFYGKSGAATLSEYSINL